MVMVVSQSFIQNMQEYDYGGDTVDKERAVESIHLNFCEAFNVISHGILIIRLVQ